MNLTNLQNKVFLLTKSNSTSFAAADLNAAINNACERVVGLINNADQRWQFDDSNQTDLPVATTTITSGQQDYSLTTSHLTIDRVEIKDSNGNWRLLKSIDEHEIRFQALAEGETTRTGAYFPATGIPVQYDKLGNSIFLYPVPNYTQASSLKIYFTRGPIALSAGGDIPGFNSLFHDLIAYWVAYEYALANGQASANGLFAAIQRKEQSIVDFYAQRSRDERPRMGVSTNGQTAMTVSGVIGTIWGDTNK